jgi:hypothetical protein
MIGPQTVVNAFHYPVIKQQCAKQVLFGWQIAGHLPRRYAGKCIRCVREGFYIAGFFGHEKDGSKSRLQVPHVNAVGCGDKS